MAVILLYHGVYKKKLYGIQNYSGKHIHIDVFNKQMKWLKKNCILVNLNEFCSIKGIKSKKKIVSITFDDSYKNVYTNAIPILNKYKIPATFFINTGFINNNKFYWTDYLEILFNLTKEKNLSLNYSPIFLKKKFDIKTNKEKISTIIFIKEKLKKIIKNERNKIINIIKCNLHVKKLKYTNSENYKTLTWKEVKKINNFLRYEVGGHTTNHEILTFLNENELKKEVDDCIKKIKKELNNETNLFSYPEGKFNNFSINRLKKNFIKICPTAASGINKKNTSNFFLKRYMPGFMQQKFPLKI